MKKRFGIWMIIICILAIGISVTKLTHDFIEAQGVETAALVQTLEITAVENGEIAVNAVRGIRTAERLKNESAKPNEAVSENEIRTEKEPENMVSSNSEIKDTTVEKAEEESVLETVKSPLEPAVESDTEFREKLAESESSHAQSFFKRFAQTEENVLKIWEKVSADNRNAYQTASEQEYLLWDYELNLIYPAIRNKMSDAEAETLKVSEIEWIRERDRYAEMKADKTGAKNIQNQNPEYTKALAEKTKERCYWLVSEYEAVLDREDEKQESLGQ